MVDRIRNAAISVGTTPVKIGEELLAGQRSVMSIVNTSTGGQNITIQVGQQAAIPGAGIFLYPGGSWSESRDSAFEPANQEFWAVSSAAGGTLAIMERVKV